MKFLRRLRQAWRLYRHAVPGGVWCCEQCKSINIEWRLLVNPNTGEYNSDWPTDSSDVYCFNCEKWDTGAVKGSS